MAYRPLEPIELTTLLIRHYGIHWGLWTLHVRFHTSDHNYVAPEMEAVYPAVIVGVRSIGLRPVKVADELTVDAAAVNPDRAGRPG